LLLCRARETAGEVLRFGTRKKAKASFLFNAFMKIRSPKHKNYRAGLTGLLNYLGGTKKYILNIESSMCLSNGDTWGRSASIQLARLYETTVLPPLSKDCVSRIVMLSADNHELKVPNKLLPPPDLADVQPPFIRPFTPSLVRLASSLPPGATARVSIPTS
jgi:hypothetical protein